MKKFYNKALIYQALYNARWPLFAGGLFIAFISYVVNENIISYLRNDISTLNSDTVYGIDFMFIIILSGILFMVYITITGFNKRNTIMFLNSGPFTRESIKKNELLVLFGSLLLFILIYLYITFCMIFRERELFSLSSHLYPTLMFDLLKIFLVGTAFICYLEFWDMLFSNLFVTIIAMGGAPITLYYVFNMIRYISWSLPYRFSYSSIDIAGNYRYSLGVFMHNQKPFEHGYFYDYTVVFITLIIGIIILLLTINYLNKKISIEKMNKIFIFPLAEKITFRVISFCISLPIVAFISKLYLETVIWRRADGYQYSMQINNLKATLYLCLYIIMAILISLIINKILKKIIKKFI